MADVPLPKPQSPPGVPAAGGSNASNPPQPPTAPPPSAMVVPGGSGQPAPSQPPQQPAQPMPQPPANSGQTSPGSVTSQLSGGGAVSQSTAPKPPPAPLGQNSNPSAPPPQPPKPTTPPPTGAGGSSGSKPPTPPKIQTSAKKGPSFASIKSSPLKIGAIVVGVLLLVGTILFAAMQFLGGGSSSTPTTNRPTQTGTPSASGAPGTGSSTGRSTTLTYWGLWEPSTVLDEVLSDFEDANPGIEVNYVQQRHPDYRERLQTAVATQNGPDLFRFHASWTPMLQNELAPLPSSVMSISEFRETFYPVAAQQLQVNGQIVGIPLMYDGLGLYYNKDILSNAGLQPPQTWAELKTQAQQLTVESSDGSIERGGLAIGNASNVEHFSDILGLLMLQNGADLSEPNSPEGQEALQFYTNFIATDDVWSEDLPTSTVAFARGEAAMMFAPSWRAHEVLAVNPDLNFGIAQVPSLGTDKISWASYWAEGVNAKSNNKNEAWLLLEYLSSAEVMQKMYNDQSQVRAFGAPYSRVDLADSLASDPYVAPYLADAPFATGWYLSSYTHDNGLNDQMIKYYRDAVNAVLEGDRPSEVMGVVEQGTNQVLRQYNAQ